MSVHPKLMIVAGIAIAGLGLIGAGAGATFTAQVSATTEIRTGGIGLSLNDKTGSDVSLDVDGKDIGSHFAPITKDLRLKNTGTLDMASTFLNLSATGCRGGEGAPLAEALQVTFTDETNGKHKQIYSGSLCSLSRSVSEQDASSENEQGFLTPPAHPNVGSQLPDLLRAGQSIPYRIVIQPRDAEQGLPTAAQFTKATISIVFTGFDY
jgi:Camelysin metallo-endopeptidase